MSIAHPTHEFYYTKKFDDNKVPFVEIHFQLHHQDNQTLAKVKALFPGTQLTESNTAKLITIDNITIDQVIKLANLETLLSHAKTIPQHIQTVIATEKEVYPRDKNNKTEENTATTAAQTLVENRIVDFGLFGKYDSSASNNRIHPTTISQAKNTKHR